MALQGLELINPSAVTVTGTGSSAAIGANGSVTFTSAVTLKLQGVFSSRYENYQILYRATSSNGAAKETLMQLLSGSTGNASTYNSQRISASSSVVSAALTTNSWARIGQNINVNPEGFILFVYAPYSIQFTAGRSMCAYSESSAYFDDTAWCHTVVSSFDGMYFDFQGNGVTGRFSVYGMRK